MSKKWIYAGIAGVVALAAVVALFVTAPIPEADAATSAPEPVASTEAAPEPVADTTPQSDQTQPAQQSDPTPDPAPEQPATTPAEPEPAPEPPAFVPSPNPVESAEGLTLINEPLAFGPAWSYLFEIDETCGELRTEPFQVTGTDLRFSIVVHDLPPGQTLHASLVPCYNSQIIRTIGSFSVTGADQVELTGIHPEYYSLEVWIDGPELDDFPTYSVTLEEK